MGDQFRICFICGKLGGVDGVSLEVDKWIYVLKALGHTVFTIAGKYIKPLASIPKKNQIVVDRIRFDSPEQHYYENLVFPYLSGQPSSLTKEMRNSIVDKMTLFGSDVANTIYEKLKKHDIDVLIAENTNAMPMTLLGGIAVYQLATERRVATIFHHHDFWWERSRFSNNHIEALLNEIMPPSDLGSEHIVLTSYAAHILRSIKRVRPIIIPNCEDFDNPVQLDEYNRHFRKDLGFKDDDILVMQPTRIVRRKRIEDSVELLAKLVIKYPDIHKKIHYIISLYQGDEPDDHYVDEIKQLAKNREIPLHMISDRVFSQRGNDKHGKRLYTNRDVIANADLVTYLPVWEGFGNALLETIAARIPLITTTYLVYKTDIKITGLKNIEIRDTYDEQAGKLMVSDKVVDEIYFLLNHPQEKNQIVDMNFDIGKREFGYNTLSHKLQNVLNDYADEIRASRKRLEKSKLLYSV
ncbi:MAG: glycosyltransferase family 4 protein [Spirochaetales bacterium]|nr:glycosyltransferase family 4 protein [Spirochaetales bacterium]